MIGKMAMDGGWQDAIPIVQDHDESEGKKCKHGKLNARPNLQDTKMLASI